ncbi:unnamed protein product, partial [Iphiclides podalirius]
MARVGFQDGAGVGVVVDRGGRGRRRCSMRSERSLRDIRAPDTVARTRPPIALDRRYKIVRLPPARFEFDFGALVTNIRDNISSWVLWWRQRHLRMGAPQTPKPIEEDDCVPRVAIVDELREVQQDRKLERRRGAGAPRRRGLDSELEGERRRPRRKPRKR